MGVKNLQANVDSRLVANQVNGFYTAKESGMVQYLNKVKTLTKSFEEFSIKQIPRSENKKADALSKIASTSFAHLNKQVLVEELKEKQNERRNPGREKSYPDNGNNSVTSSQRFGVRNFASPMLILYLIEERREQAAIQEAKSKKKMESITLKSSRNKLQNGEMVYRSNEASHAQDEVNSGPKWDGPYEV
ncbi:reverse transcriptase domain-containing protein [Tanacetum coccineum]